MTEYWQFTVLGLLIIIAGLINMSDKINLNGLEIGFKYKEYPCMQPVKICTAGKGFWGAIWLWLTSVRTWQLTKNWKFELRGETYIIPKGFLFDGASVPKFLSSFLSPVGVLLIGGLVHDYAYKYSALKKFDNVTKLGTIVVLDKSECDKLFRDISIAVNGFHLLNYLAYWALRCFGFVAWNKHRKSKSKYRVRSNTP